MRRRRCVRTILIWGLVSIGWVASGRAQQGDEERFEVRGKVVNAATGAGVGNALVQLVGPEAQMQFSGDDGSFVFAEVQRGSYQVVARKPGYFNDRELAYEFRGPSELHSVPMDGDVMVKLTPEGIIYGRVENENGQAVEGLTVRAQSWQVEDGVRRLEIRATAMTDDEGQFRIAELRPDDYHISFFPGNQGGERYFNRLTQKKQDEQGYGTQFYPGVANAGSASVIPIRGGSQVQIIQALKPQKLYEVAGVVHGARAERGFVVNLMDTNGDQVERNVHMDEKSGAFQIEGVPEGTYLLMAVAPDMGGVGPEEGQQLMAMMPIHLNKDLTGLVLMLGRGASVDVRIEDEIPGEENEIHQVNLDLASREFRQLSQSIILPQPKEVQGAPQRFEGIAPGTYEVEARAIQKGYVASVRCGDLDLMRDELTVAAGAAVPPIEVTLRGDGAELDVATTENGQPVGASVVLYSEEYPKKSYQGVVMGNGGVAQIGNIRPGTYKVVALKGRGLQEVEFRDAAFMEKYVAQGKEMNLKPGDKVSVTVEAQTVGEE